MNRTLTLKLISSNHELVKALLANDSAIACAKAVVPVYPFPNQQHASWNTCAGQILSELAANHEMSIASMHRSPSAAAVVLFPAEWRCTARKIARQRVFLASTEEDLVEKAICQVRKDNCCDRASAILQLAAARVELLEHDGMAAFITYSDDGCYISTTVEHVLSPDCATLGTLQDELDITEQLVYIVLNDDLSEQYRRISSEQPLAMARPALLSNCLASCQQCMTNWATNASGEVSSVLVCPHPGCLCMVHTCCLGLGPIPTCPQHGQYTEVHLESTVSGRAVSARGLEPKDGAWFVQLCNWKHSEHTIGSIHPSSVGLLVSSTDAHIHAQKWAVSPTSGLTPRRFAHALDVLHQLSHLHLTHSCALNVPSLAVRGVTQDLGQLKYPALRGMAQMPHGSNAACRLSHGIAHTLQMLQVYSEPSFSMMLDRFEQLEGYCVDHLVLQWMKSSMPILCGLYAQTPGDAKAMHKQVCNAITSPKSAERAMAAGRQVRHWISAQPDAVLAASKEEEDACFKRLGIVQECPQAAVREAPAATPDVASSTVQRPRAVPGVYTVFAVRLLMNPSLYQKTLTVVLRDAGMSVGINHFQARELDPIGPVMCAQDVVAFRTACIESSAYGRVYLWLLEHGTKYTASTETDATGMLPAWQPKETEEQPRRWTLVADLCACVDAAYVDMGCGSMAYWQQVLMNDRPAYVFETNLNALLQLQLAGAPESVHVVPCTWKGMCLSELGCRQAVVVARKHAPVPGQVHAHYLMDAPGDTHPVQSGAVLDAEWCHRVSSKTLISSAAYALRFWTLMRGK